MSGKIGLCFINSIFCFLGIVVAINDINTINIKVSVIIIWPAFPLGNFHADRRETHFTLSQQRYAQCIRQQSIYVCEPSLDPNIDFICIELVCYIYTPSVVFSLSFVFCVVVYSYNMYIFHAYLIAGLWQSKNCAMVARKRRFIISICWFGALQYSERISSTPIKTIATTVSRYVPI